MRQEGGRQTGRGQADREGAGRQEDRSRRCRCHKLSLLIALSIWIESFLAARTVLLAGVGHGDVCYPKTLGLGGGGRPWRLLRSLAGG